MKITFLKDHEGFKAGEEADVNTARGKAYIEAGLAEGFVKEKSENVMTSADGGETWQEKNSSAGPNAKKKK